MADISSGALLMATSCLPRNTGPICNTVDSGQDLIWKHRVVLIAPIRNCSLFSSDKCGNFSFVPTYRCWSIGNKWFWWIIRGPITLSFLVSKVKAKVWPSFTEKTCGFTHPPTSVCNVYAPSPPGSNYIWTEDVKACFMNSTKKSCCVFTLFSVHPPTHTYIKKSSPHVFNLWRKLISREPNALTQPLTSSIVPDLTPGVLWGHVTVWAAVKCSHFILCERFQIRNTISQRDLSGCCFFFSLTQANSVCSVCVTGYFLYFHQDPDAVAVQTQSGSAKVHRLQIQV